MTNPIDMTPRARETLMALLERHLPDTTVWAYGSRVKGTARPHSDLDLVAFASPKQRMQVFELKEEFEESDLPFRVDLLVWDEIPESFHREIEREHALLLSGGGGVRDAAF